MSYRGYTARVEYAEGTPPVYERGCGALVSAQVGSCPKCGLVFGGVDSPAAKGK